jgi:hypothetical protein
MVRSQTVHRVFERYDSETRMNLAASHKLGYRKRQSVGEFYYVSDVIPNVAFPTRSAAENAERRAESL